VYPDIVTIRNLEKDTLRQITQISEFGRLGELQAAANAGLAGVNDQRGGVDVHLGFALDIRIRGDRQGKAVSRRIDVGALVAVSPDKKTVSNASYSLLICRYANPQSSPIVRKVHFDYESLALRNHNEPKPTAHLQICGKLSPHHLKAGYIATRLNALYPTWEKPRFPLPPTSIALLLNWLLLEFQTDPASQGILNSPAWRNLVARAERAVLTKYFSDATKFLSSAGDKQKRFLQTYLYNMSVD
jgi:hypothetical protein